MRELRVDASLENVEKVQKFIQDELMDYELSLKTENEINIAIEEIFVNIAHYAYSPEHGEAIIGCDIELGNPPMVKISFTDWGKPFNPLAKEEVDTTLPAEKRNIGGLGIHMVKKMMDELEYRYEEQKNIFIVWKKI